jgi:hypothetical protein
MKKLERKDGHEDEAILAHDQGEPSAWRHHVPRWQGCLHGVTLPQKPPLLHPVDP